MSDQSTDVQKSASQEAVKPTVKNKFRLLLDNKSRTTQFQNKMHLNLKAEKN